jgi:hypothetical protein
MGKLEPQIILKTDARSAVLELSREKFAAKSNSWDENRLFFEATASERGQERALVLNHLPAGAAAGGRAGTALFRYALDRPSHIPQRTAGLVRS